MSGYYKLLFRQLGLAFALFTFCRILFFLYNFRLVADECNLLSFIIGLRYDASAIAFLYAPFLLTGVWRLLRPASASIKKLSMWWFMLASSIAIVLNSIDFSYFSFVIKRSTVDLWTLAGTGNDVLNLLPTFIAFYWHVFLIAIALFILVYRLFRKTEGKAGSVNNRPLWYHIILYLILVTGAAVTGARGGFQLRPLDIISAVENGHFREAAVRLNTPFTVMKSLGKRNLERKSWFSNESGRQYFNPVAKCSAGTDNKPNVIIIILESFSKEYIGAYNHGHGYTPFLDSLMQHSLVAEQAYANGMKSIEGIPAVVAAIPAFQDEPFITSGYGANELNALPSVLSDMGYDCAFYHGGNNGTMAFDRFAKAAGYRHYFGRNEYKGPDAYDGRWGIRDLEFLKFTAASLSGLREPFLGTVFTLSSHHPFEVPPPYDKTFNNGKIPIHNVVRYSDYSLRMFFKEAAKTDWYRHTVFILTADHCGPSYEDKYRTHSGRYAIPLIIYSPGGQYRGKVNGTSQQCDIMPTVLDITGCSGTYVAFGQSLLQKKNGFAFTRLDNIYQMITDRFLLLHDGRDLIGLYDRRNDPAEKNNLVEHLPDSLQPEAARSQLRMMALIQSINNRMLDNRLNKE